MDKALAFILLLIFTCTFGCQGQSPAITYASSFYKTAAGAIGPTGIVATTTYDLKIDSHKTIILDSAIISGLTVIGDGIILPTNKEGTIEFRIFVAKHQKDTVWYNGELEFQGITVSANVRPLSKVIEDKDYPDVVLYLRTSEVNHVIVKQTFDQMHNQYNK
jgi:hypothetical protein